VSPTIQKYDTIRCIDSISLNSFAAAALKYNWNNGDTSATIKTGNSGVFYVVRKYDLLGCNRDTVYFNVIKLNKLKIDSFQRIGCFNSSNSGQIKLFASGDTFGIKYGLIPFPTSSSNIILSQKNGTQKYWVRNSGLCVDSITIIHDSIIPSFSKRNNYCIQDSSGMMRLTLTGGYAPFIFNLTGKSPQSIDSFNGLGKGTYTISTTDKVGCTVSKIDSIVPFTNLALSISSDSVSCFGGANGIITALLTGGLPNYKYSINNGAFVNSGVFNTLTVGIYTIKTRDSAKCERDTSITIAQYPAIKATFTNIKNCPFNANGSLNILATGGKPSYQFKLNTGLFQASSSYINLLDGIYSITVKDAKNCTQSFLDTIGSYPKPDLTLLSKKNLSCYQSNDGKIKLMTTSGTTPYSYSWSIAGSSDSLINLPIGTYTATVTDFNTCKDTLTTTITQPDTIQASFVLNQPLCFNQASGKIKVIAQGGTPPYKYSIDGGAYISVDTFVGLLSGTHIVSIRDTNLCLKSFTLSLINPTKLAVSIAVDSALCFGSNTGKITLTGLAATPPYRYKINAGIYTSAFIFTGLIAANYNLSLRDTNNCQLDTNATVYQYTPLNFMINLIDTIRCKNGSDGKISITASGGKSTYQYSINGGVYQASPIFSGLNKGKKIITLKDANNCTRIDSITMIEPSGITSTLTIANHVQCYGESNAKAKISAIGGTTPYTYLWSNGVTIDSVTNLNLGLKYILITDARNCKDSTPFTITQPDSLKANFNLYHPLCYNTLGSIKAIGQGGTTPYQFSINGGGFGILDSFINLTGQLYTLSIRDANLCQSGYTRTLITPSQIMATYSIDSVQCFGAATGKITTSGSGGTAPLTYLKNTFLQPNNVFTSLIANSYFVQVIDINGCKKDTNLSVYQFPDIITTYPTTNINCYGTNTGSISINASGGAGGLTYAIDASAFGISNAFSGLAAGTYSMKIRDKYLCQKSQNVTLTQIDSMQISVFKSDNPCFADAKGKYKLSVINGTAPYLFSFNGGAYSSLDSQINLTVGTYNYAVKDANNCIKSGIVSITQPSKLAIATIIDSVKCFKINTGQILINASGGTPSYSYSVNSGGYTGANNFINLAAGNYYLQIKDANQCIKDTNVVLYSSDSLYHTLVIDSLKCNNQTTGQVTVSAVGGKPPYEHRRAIGIYGPNPIIPNLGSGGHTIYTRDNYGCIVSTSINLPNPPAINITTTNLTNNKCFGESLGIIQTTSSGGNPPYTYLWSNGISTTNNLNLPANNYTLSVTDANSCLKTASYTITEPTAIGYTVNKQNVRCNGEANGSIQVTISGASPPYTYLWSNSSSISLISNLIAANYSVTVTDNNLCTTTRSYTVTEPGAINYTVNKKNSSCTESQDGELTIQNLTGGTTPYSYQWSNSLNGVTKITNLPPFTKYTVTVSDDNNCYRIDSGAIDTMYKLRAKFSFISFPKCPKSPVSFELKPSNGVSPFQLRANSFSIQDSSKFLNYPNNIYKITIQDARNCRYDTTVDMMPKDTLVARLKTYDPTCQAGNIFTSRYFVTGGNLPYTFLWPGALLTLGDSAQHDSKGIFTVTVIDASGCQVKEQFKLDPPEFALNGSIIDKLNLRCYNLSEGTMTAYAIGGSPPYRYKWAHGDTNSIAKNLSANTLYRVTISDQLNCNYVVYDSLTQPDTMQMSLRVIDKSCHNTSDGSITILSSGGTAPNRKYTYSLDSLGPFQLETYFKPLNDGKYKVYQRDENKCIKRKDTIVDIRYRISLTLDTLYKIYLTQTVDLVPNINFTPLSTNVKYAWIPTNGLTCADCPATTVNNYLSSKYTLVVAYGNGCVDSISTRVIVENNKLDFFVPNAFSPNAEKAENRLFKAYGNYIASFRMDIYNRWGEKVFNSDNINTGWDGSYKNQLAPIGVYTYLIEAQTIDKRSIRQVGEFRFFY
jgi:gliding motility-associated-like protein